MKPRRSKRAQAEWMPPPGYVPPMPYADVCPDCKTQHTRNKFCFRDGPVGLDPNGGYVDREWGYFCEECETKPFWMRK